MSKKYQKIRKIGESDELNSRFNDRRAFNLIVLIIVVLTSLIMAGLVIAAPVFYFGAASILGGQNKNE